MRRSVWFFLLACLLASSTGCFRHFVYHPVRHRMGICCDPCTTSCCRVAELQAPTPIIPQP